MTEEDPCYCELQYTLVIEEEWRDVWRTQEDQFFHPLIFAILIICPILK